MASDASDSIDLATEIVQSHWGIRGQLIRTDLGVSRITWRVGNQYWLSQCEERRSAELVCRAEVQRRLLDFLREKQSSLSVPEIVVSRSRDLIAVDQGYAWCLTRHLDGFHPDSHDPNAYRLLAAGLADFHSELSLFEEEGSVKLSNGVSTGTRVWIERMKLKPLIPFTGNPREIELLERACDWLLPRLSRLELLPRQPVHGDWTPQNVFFNRRNGGVQLTAVLDFEAIATDPVHVDVANIFSTLLMWSDLNRPRERMQEVLTAYENSSGLTLEQEDIHIAMLSHWFCNYWGWRERLENGGLGRQVKDRLCLRIASVLEFVTASI
jgi:Ser/Thr protein kinase RdoA (MazF antagonist)